MRFALFSGKHLTGLSVWRAESRVRALFCFKFVPIYYMGISVEGFLSLMRMIPRPPVFLMVD